MAQATALQTGCVPNFKDPSAWLITLPSWTRWDWGVRMRFWVGIPESGHSKMLFMKVIRCSY
eukprot:3187596-Karenia_brevis.AAC.1